ncbi:MAG: flagellar export chaperone FlgN [Oscillospiraceae bacterium]|nr:flagellar export chaperone FlgN [Oscillospiraceae bacterium]
MNNPFYEYLQLLDQIGEQVEHLTDLAKQKITAVRNDDLLALDEILKQEQASSLLFRGLEQKQSALLNSTGLKGIPLSSLAENFPPKMRLEAKQCIEQLQTRYRVYQTSAEVARNTLECNLHEIEKVLASMSPASAGGPGYQPAEPEIPSSMKTDFRA